MALLRGEIATSSLSEDAIEALERDARLRTRRAGVIMERHLLTLQQCTILVEYIDQRATTLAASCSPIFVMSL